MQTIPVINCHHKDFECVERKVRTAERFATWVHVDVADGAFTFNKSWDDPKQWASLKTPLKLEVHLMVLKPEDVLGAWLAAGAKRVIFHLEAIRESHPPTEVGAAIARVTDECAKRDAEMMLATNPETPNEALEPYLDNFREFQVLAVYPGPAGQPFLPTVLGKIEFLRAARPDARIEIDGGITPEVARRVKDAGADVVVAGSYIFGNADPKAAYGELQSI